MPREPRAARGAEQDEARELAAGELRHAAVAGRPGRDVDRPLHPDVALQRAHRRDGAERRLDRVDSETGDRRAGDVEDAATAIEVDAQVVVERRDPAVRLAVAQVRDAGAGREGAVGQRERVDVGGGQPERGAVVAHPAQRDRAAIAGGGAGQRAVEPLHAACGAGQRIERDGGPAPEALARLPFARARRNRPRGRGLSLGRARIEERLRRLSLPACVRETAAATAGTRQRAPPPRWPPRPARALRECTHVRLWRR